MKMTKIALAAVLAMGATAANAAGTYVELGYAATHGEGGGLSVNIGAIRANIGASITENMDAEFMAMTGLSSANVGAGQVNLDHSWGFFLKPKAKLNESTEAFARLGYVNTQISATGPGGSGWARDNSLSYGLGVQFAASKTTSVTLDWTRLYDKDGGLLDAASINAKFDF